MQFIFGNLSAVVGYIFYVYLGVAPLKKEAGLFVAIFCFIMLRQAPHDKTKGFSLQSLTHSIAV